MARLNNPFAAPDPRFPDPRVPNAATSSPGFVPPSDVASPVDGPPPGTGGPGRHPVGPQELQPESADEDLTIVRAEDGTPRIVHTDVGKKDGFNRCPQCGSTDVALNPRAGTLRCDFCRFEWEGDAALAAFGLDTPIDQLRGLVLGSGSQDIIPSTDVVMTYKCPGCGAEIVVDTADSMQARCHWCRSKLSVNEQIPNGAVPDMVLPFKIPKEEAVRAIAAFQAKRKFYANRKFLEEFDPHNVMGVYLPYMVVDINARAHFSGEGEHQTRRYTVGSGKDAETRYDADVYQVAREFDVHIDDLTVESSSERLNLDTSRNTNNVINSILPFDVENSVQYDANFLSGFTSEKRDTNVDDLGGLVQTQALDIARFLAKDMVGFYDRGVRWDDQRIDVVGQRWVSAYLPVWLYSYHEERKGKSLTHYVAVNARTGETMGSIPLNKSRLLAMSGVVQLLGTIAAAMFLFVM